MPSASIRIAILTATLVGVLSAQSKPEAPVDPNAIPPSAIVPRKDIVTPQKETRILYIFPNYRTINLRDKIEPLSTSEKYHLAMQESFDPATVALAGVNAGLGQLSNSNAEWGQGGKGFGKRFAAAYADQVIGDYMTEAILPSLLHQDPRYFRLGQGSFSKRAVYALTRVVRTRTDAGAPAWNYSEVGGNAIAAGIATAYYPASQRTFGQVGSRLALQVGTDAGFNLLKEFWPEIQNKFFRRRQTAVPSAFTTGM